jgi:hypothetical protein
MRRIDNAKFEQRGGSSCSNSYFVLRRTTCCGSFGVEDEELLTFFFDSKDLARRIELFGDEKVCPICGADRWDLTEVNDDSWPDEWKWAAEV